VSTLRVYVSVDEANDTDAVGHRLLSDRWECVQTKRSSGDYEMPGGKGI
jgi:hypothetical protein